MDVVESSTAAADNDTDEKTESALEQITNMIADCLVLLRSVIVKRLFHFVIASATIY